MSLASSSSPPSILLPLLFLIVFLFFVLRTEGHESAALSDGSPCPVSQYSGGICPVNCFRSDPVCGENGVTYWCGCLDAACAGVRVAKIGYCEVGNGGSGLVSGQAFLLIHIVWLIILGFSVLCGFL